MNRTGECVLNLPSADMVGAVDRLARTTGSKVDAFGIQYEGKSAFSSPFSWAA